ncbi:MAG: hypothetical protein Q9187_000469 [Circinaria calcarea]
MVQRAVTARTRAPVHEVLQDCDFTDEQIKQLLRNAETRLKSSEDSKTEVIGTASPNSINSLVGFPRLDPGKITKPYVASLGDIARADSVRLLDEQARQLSNMARRVEDPVPVKIKLGESKKATAGEDWFNLPRTNLTPELKRDFQLLRMRSVLDPKRHYRKDNGKVKAAEFSHVGTIVEGPTEFYSSRLLKRDRKSTFVGEILAREAMTRRFESKYQNIQTKKISGKKAFYKALKEKRSKGIHK